MFLFSLLLKSQRLERKSSIKFGLTVFDCSAVDNKSLFGGGSNLSPWI
ncbi:hypothetical protein V3564_01595 [Bartonella sp. B12(2025)]